MKKRILVIILMGIIAMIAATLLGVAMLPAPVAEEENSHLVGRTPDYMIAEPTEPMEYSEVLARLMRDLHFIGEPLDAAVGARIYSNWTVI